jgi:hypothetical protein
MLVNGQSHPPLWQKAQRRKLRPQVKVSKYAYRNASFRGSERSPTMQRNSSQQRIGTGPRAAVNHIHFSDIGMSDIDSSGTYIGKPEVRRPRCTPSRNDDTLLNRPLSSVGASRLLYEISTNAPQATGAAVSSVDYRKLETALLRDVDDTYYVTPWTTTRAPLRAVRQKVAPACLSVTFRSHRSTDPTYVWCRPHASARPSCDRPCLDLKALTLSASIFLSLELGCRTARMR